MINKDLIKRLSKKLDDMFDWTKIVPNKIIGGIIEMGDGLILGNGLSYLNDKYGDKIPVDYVDEIELMIEKFIEGDYVGMLEAVPAGFDQAIDITCFDDDFEAVFIATNFNAIVNAIMYYAVKKSE